MISPFKPIREPIRQVPERIILGQSTHEGSRKNPVSRRKPKRRGRYGDSIKVIGRKPFEGSLLNKACINLLPPDLAWVLYRNRGQIFKWALENVPWYLNEMQEVITFIESKGMPQGWRSKDVKNFDLNRIKVDKDEIHVENVQFSKMGEKESYKVYTLCNFDIGFAYAFKSFNGERGGYIIFPTSPDRYQDFRHFEIESTPNARRTATISRAGIRITSNISAMAQGRNFEALYQKCRREEWGYTDEELWNRVTTKTELNFSIGSLTGSERVGEVVISDF